MKYTLLKVDGTQEELFPTAEQLSEYQKEEPGSLSLDYMYKTIGCDTVQLVELGNEDGVNELWCDEEGLLKNDWVMNPTATKLYRAAYPTIDPRELAIVGNAILVEKTV